MPEEEEKSLSYFVARSFPFPISNCSLTLLITWLNPRAGKMTRILYSDWLPERARREHLARSGFPALVPQKKVFNKCIHTCYKCFFDKACSFNMAGYWPLSFLCVFSNLNFVSVCNVPKRRLRGMRPKGR